MIPTNLQECFDELKKLKGLEGFKSMLEEEVIVSYHFSLGQHLRKKWGLWKGGPLYEYFEKMGLHHPDDMSGVILLSFHRHLNEQIQTYKEYWKKEEGCFDYQG